MLKGRISHEFFKKQVEAQKEFMMAKEKVIFDMLINLLIKNVWNSVYIKNEILSTLKVCFKFYNPVNLKDYYKIIIKEEVFFGTKKDLKVHGRNYIFYKWVDFVKELLNKTRQ